MGYRSDVAMAFYASNDGEWEPMRLWLNANKPKNITEDDVYDDDEDNKRIIVRFYNVKWYEGYDDVGEITSWFDTFAEQFTAIGGCAEYVRVGESLEDIPTIYHGDCEYLLQVHREITTRRNKMEKPTYTLKITDDLYPENPREWDNAATMWCAHSRYSLGDEQIDTSSYDSWDEALASIDHVVALPLYLYDHSGITMSTTPFSCRWDSGQVGWITMSKEQIINTYGGKRLTAKKKQRALDLMRAEVEEYDAYLTGEVYEYSIIDADGEIVESCAGYYDRASVEADGEQALARWNR